jgi:acid stress-induced BolA-like protein IbaG/YrbA
MKKIGVSKGITENDIFNLSYKIITNEEKIDISEEIQNSLLNKLNKEPINYQGDNYFYEKSQL